MPLGMAERAMRALALLWIGAALTFGASSAHAVYFKSQSSTTTGGTVIEGGALSAGINFEASFAEPPGECASAAAVITKVELFEVGNPKSLARSSYNPTRGVCQSPEYQDLLRSGTLSANFGVGVHQIYLRATGSSGIGSNSSTYTVTVNQANDASFASQVVPATMVAGQTYPVAVTMTNTGVNSWAAGSTYKLGSQNAQDNTIWGLNRVVVNSQVAPNANHVFSFNVTAPATAGTYNFQWRMMKEGAEWFGDASTNLAVKVALPPTLTVQRTPATMVAGEGFGLVWTSTNATSVKRKCTSTGTGFIVNETLSATSGSTTGAANSAWVGYPSTCIWTATGPGGTDAVTETMTTVAPSYNAQFVSQTVAGTVTAGQASAVSVTMKNTGTGTWAAGSTFQLGSQNPADNTTWGLMRVNNPSAVAPGGLATFSFSVTAPSSPATYNFQWKMVRSNVTWFGAATTNKPVAVVGADTPVPVDITPPHLGNADAGTLPGELGVSNAGAATYSIPIEVPPGTAGLKPGLALNYSSQAGNGPLGLGWSLSGLSSIHRCGKTIAQDGVNGRIRFDGGDRLCLDGQRLMLVNKAPSDTNYWSSGAEYRTEIDSLSRITALGTGNSLRFKVETKDHRVLWFGGNSAGANTSSNVKAIVTPMNVGTINEVQPYDKSGALSWAVDSIKDRAGNFIAFNYEQDAATGEHRPTFIRYGGTGLASHAAVQFVHEARPDAWKRYVDDARNDLRSRIAHIKTYHGSNLDGDVVANGTLVRDYSLAYEQSPTSGRSMLKSASVCARNPRSGVQECLPASTFAWGKPDPAKSAGWVSRGSWPGAPILTTTGRVGDHNYWAMHKEYFEFADFENHGYTDVLEKRVASPSPREAPGADGLIRDANSIAMGSKRTQYRYFHNDNGTGFTLFNYKLNTGNAFVVLATADFNGDGAPDLLVDEGTTSGVPKICLSPLSRRGPQGAPGSMITFNCDSGLAAIGSNLDLDTPHVIDVLGEGRTALYSRFNDSLGYARLCVQGNCVDDPDAPVNYLGYTYAKYGIPPSPLTSHIRFAEMVDFAGTGKQQDVRWTSPHYVKVWYDADGNAFTVNDWVNTQPRVVMSGFRQPNSPDSAYSAGSMPSYDYPDYPIDCPPIGCVPALPKYTFHAGNGAVDLNGSGYSSLLFGFVEFGYPGGIPVYNKAETTLCLSTGRRLDCGVRKKYSGEAYMVPGVLGNYIGDGLPSYSALPTKVGPNGRLPGGGAHMCRALGDDTTGGTGTGDANMVCEPWPGLPDSVSGGSFTADLLGTGRMQTVAYHRGQMVNDTWQEDGRWEVFEPVDRSVANQALDRIHQFTNGVGATSKVEYVDGVPTGTVTRSGASTLGYPQHVTAGTGKIVKRLRRDNGNGPDRTTVYAYEDSGIDLAGRGSLGFAKVTSTDEQTGLVTSTAYSQAWPHAGMALGSTVTKPGAAKALSTTTHTLAANTITQTYGATVCPYVGKSVVERYDLGGEFLGRVTTQGVDTANVQYDSHCNLLKVKVVSEGSATDPSATFTTTTENTYVAEDKPNWLLDLVKTSKVSKRHSADTATVTRTKDFTYEPGSTGRVATEVVQAATSTLKLTIAYGRADNPFGLVNTRKETWRDPLTATNRSRTTTTAYDANGRAPVTMSNALNHSETRAYDFGSGAMVSRTDPNGHVTSWLTNGFGRPLVELRPDGNETRLYVKQCAGDGPSGAVVANVTEHFHGTDRIAVPQVTYLDSAGRTLRSQTWGFDGRVIVADQRYDDLGRPWETDQPRYSGDTAHLASRQAYDELGRVTKVTSLDDDGAEQALTTSYQGMVTVVTNALGQKRTDKRDVLGQVRAVVDHLQGLTQFAYDPFGNLTRTVDPNGNVISLSFDALGRKTALQDPDLGLIDYTVDPLGRTRRQTSPNQRAGSRFTDMDYDLLDRMTLRMEPDLESRWVYDTATKGVGQLAEAYTIAGGIKDYRRLHTYDSLGRPGATTQVLTDGNYTSTPAYDAWGRLSQQTHQRGSDTAKVFNLRYNNHGYPSSVERAGLVLSQVVAQDASQRVLHSLLGNGLIQTRTYSPHTGRLQTGMLKTGSEAVRLQEGYTYDPLGNVTRRGQYWDTSGFEETFAYDGLNRLVSSGVEGLSAKTFSYDAAGNLKTKTGAGTYAYPAQGPAAIRPHAVQSVSGMAGTFSYDANGNLLSGAGRTISWASFDMPITITKGSNSSTFAYGPEHQRAKQTRGDGLVILYAGAQEVETKAGVTTVKTYWPGGAGLEIDKTGQSTQLMWTHADRLGSPVAITDSAGNLAEKLAYDAWGKRRSLDGATTPDALDGLVDNKGFTHHEMLDQLDLVHMNGRVYDPWVARFMSGDPIIQELNNGQSYNRYSYVVNNPTNLTDPTGFARNCTAQTGSNIPICNSGPDDVVVNHVDGSKEVLLGDGTGKTIESLGGIIVKNGIQIVSAKQSSSGVGTGGSNSNPGVTGHQSVVHYDEMPPVREDGLEKENLVQVQSRAGMRQGSGLRGGQFVIELRSEPMEIRGQVLESYIRIIEPSALPMTIGPVGGIRYTEGYVRTLETTYREVLTRAARRGQNVAWAQFREAVRNGTPHSSKQYLTFSEGAELLRTGRITGWQAHHQLDVARFPSQAANPAYIRPLPGTVHSSLHMFFY